MEQRYLGMYQPPQPKPIVKIHVGESAIAFELPEGWTSMELWLTPEQAETVVKVLLVMGAVIVGAGLLSAATRPSYRAIR